MNQTVLDQICIDNPYYEKIKNKIILVTEDIYKELVSGPKIKYNDIEISIKLLHEFLSNDFAYSYIEKCVNREISEINLSYIFYGDTMGSIRFNRADFIKCIDEAIRLNLISLTELESTRLEDIRKKVSYEAYKNDMADIYNITIDNVLYSIDTSIFIELIEMNDDDFHRLCSDESIISIANIPKEYLLYAMLKFFDNGCMSEYIFDMSHIKRINDLKNNTIIDIESINKHVRIDDPNQSDIEVNEELSKAILSDMPLNLSKIEQAIFIYIKMCKILTYDEEFYALDQKVPDNHKHRKLSYIKEITPSNNQVVCYEFNAIYAKLLELIGINFTIDYIGMADQTYGYSHANLEWRYHKFLVKADSTETFLGNDMMQAKLNQTLKGLECVNMNQNTKVEFKRLINRVYRMVIELENTSQKEIGHDETLDELIKEYTKCTRNIKEISLEERIQLYFHKLNNVNLSGMDFLSYVIQISKVIFTEEERKDNINIIIVRKNIHNGQYDVRPIAIIVINTVSITESPEENEYLIYDSKRNIDSIDIRDLQEDFKEELISYINPRKDPKVSGIGGINKK